MISSDSRGHIVLRVWLRQHLSRPKYEICRRTQPHFHHPQQFFHRRQSHFLYLQWDFIYFQLRFQHHRLGFLHFQLRLRLPQLDFHHLHMTTQNPHLGLEHIRKIVRVVIVATCVKKNFCLLCRPIRRGFESGHVVIFF